MDRRPRARALVAAALEGVEAELSSPRLGLCPVKLGTCRDALRRYLDELDRGVLSPRSDRDEALGRLVADAWGFDLPLAQKVIQAERAWRTC
jgi:hypothetical protein